MKIQFFITMCLYLIVQYHGRVRKGLCPDYTKIARPVNISQLAGTWYEYGRYGYPTGVSCVYGNYTQVGNRTLQLSYRGYRTKLEDWLTTEGTAEFPDPTMTAKVNFVFPKAISDTITGWTPNPKVITAVEYDLFFVMWCCAYMRRNDPKSGYLRMSVLGWTPNPKIITKVEYDEYIIMWSCSYLRPMNQFIEFSTLLTRTRPTNTSEYNKIVEKMMTHFKKVEVPGLANVSLNDHETCPEW